MPDIHLPPALRGLRLPLIAAPLFIISVPELVIARCRAGIIGSFPALNAWKEVWGAGQGIGAVTEVTGVAGLVARIARQYRDAGAGLASGFKGPD